MIAERFVVSTPDVYCGGDLVGYGPHPNEVCALIEDWSIPAIYGDYDYAIARDLAAEVRAAGLPDEFADKLVTGKEKP